MIQSLNHIYGHIVLVSNGPLMRDAHVLKTTSVAPCRFEFTRVSPRYGSIVSMTKRIASTVITSQIAAKHRAADCRMIAKRLLRAITIAGKSSRIFGQRSRWRVGTTASRTLRESMISCPCWRLIRSSTASGESVKNKRPGRSSTCMTFVPVAQALRIPPAIDCHIFGMVSKSFSPNLVESLTKANPAPRRDKRALSLLSALSSSGTPFSATFEGLRKDRIPERCFLW